MWPDLSLSPQATYLSKPVPVLRSTLSDKASLLLLCVITLDSSSEKDDLMHCCVHSDVCIDNLHLQSSAVWWWHYIFPEEERGEADTPGIFIPVVKLEFRPSKL